MNKGFIPTGFITNVKRPCLIPDWTDEYSKTVTVGLNKVFGVNSVVHQGVLNRTTQEFVARRVVGVKPNTYVDDFYYKIHIAPVEFNVGDVVGDTIVSFKLFNAYFEPRILQNVVFLGMEGVLIDIPTPSTISPLEERTYNITVTTDGPKTIDARIILRFDLPQENQTVRVLGSRSVVLPFVSLVGQSESLEWLTAIGKSYNGTEERTSLRQTPRWRMSCRFDLPDYGDRRLAENVAIGWAKRQYTIPFWHQSTRGDAPLTIGDKVVMCDTTLCGFEQNDTVMLWSTSNDHENAQIVDVLPDRITLAKPVKQNRPHFMVAPLHTAMAPNGVTVKGTSSGGEMSATFDLSHESKYTTPDEYVIFDGLAIMPFKAYGDEPRDNVKTRVDTFDNKIGSVLFNTPELRPTLDRPFNLFADGRADYLKLKRWLSYCLGQFTPFLYDTNMHDIVLQDRGVLSNTIRVQNDRFTGMGSTVRDRLVFELTDGRAIYAKIKSSAVVNPEIEVIVLDTDLKCDASEIKRISFLLCGRFASDSFTIRTLGRDRYSVSVTFKEIGS